MGVKNESIKHKEDNMKITLSLCIAILIAILISVIFIEGNVYEHGSLDYLYATILEISLFVLGIIVGRASIKR